MTDQEKMVQRRTVDYEKIYGPTTRGQHPLLTSFVFDPVGQEHRAADALLSHLLVGTTIDWECNFSSHGLIEVLLRARGRQTSCFMQLDASPDELIVQVAKSLVELAGYEVKRVEGPAEVSPTPLVE